MACFKLPGMALLAALLLGAAGQSAADDEIDRYVLSEMNRQRIPGLALLVAGPEGPVKLAGYGEANVELGAKVAPETVFQSGSIGKQFTATALMQLAAENRLDLDRSVRTYLTDSPESWQPITIAHLLAHTSGLGDYPDQFDMRRDTTEDELLQMIYASPRQFEPGTDWRYSNLGYVVLGALIHRVSGQFYGDFLAERVFRPAGMPTARIISEADIVPNRAAGYRLDQGRLQNQSWVAPTLNTTADGSLYLSLVDLAAWDRALRGEQILPQATLQRMWTPARLASGQENRAGYGYGWRCDSVNGRRYVEHGGAWQGFHAHLVRFLDDELSVAVLTNLAADSDSDPRGIAHHVAGLCDRDLLESRAAK